MKRKTTGAPEGGGLKKYIDTYQDDLKFFQDTFLRERLLGTRELSDEKIMKRMEYLQLSLAGKVYCVIIFAPYLMEKEPEEMDALLMKIRNAVCEGYRKAGIGCYTVSDGYTNAVAILSPENRERLELVDQVTRQLAHKLPRTFKVDMFVGVGEPVERISQLRRAADSASEALAYKFTFSQNNVIYARDVDRYYRQEPQNLRLHYDWIQGCFYDGNMELLAIRFRNLRAAVRGAGQNELDSMRNICIELTAAILRRAYEIGVEVSPEVDGIYTYIAGIGTADEIETWFLNYCAGLLQKIADLRQNKNRQIVHMAQEYIEANLGDRELSIRTISDAVDLSPAYFSNIFYKEMGQHLNEYINQVRVNQAKRLLLTTNDKVITIAERLGFSSSSYFNNIFKRYTGITPQRFRRSED